MLIWYVWICHLETVGLDWAQVLILTKEVKLTDMGIAPKGTGISKEDERGAVLAERARRGDYDDGILNFPTRDKGITDLCRTHFRTIGPKPSLLER